MGRMETMQEDRGVLRFVTLGSVDDGKSTLIGRLLYDSRALQEDQLAALERASLRRGAAEVFLSLLTDGLVDYRVENVCRMALACERVSEMCRMGPRVRDGDRGLA